MSGRAEGSRRCPNALKYRSNFGWGTTCQVHMPHVVADVVPDAEVAYSSLATSLQV
jgi:hypothetical protein